MIFGRLRARALESLDDVCNEKVGCGTESLIIGRGGISKDVESRDCGTHRKHLVKTKLGYRRR